jgi:hypothetical protein
LLAPRPTPKLEDHTLSAVSGFLFNVFAATLHIGGRSSIRSLRTRHPMVTGTHLSHGNISYNKYRKWSLGSSASWNSQGLSRPVMGLIYLYLYKKTFVRKLKSGRTPVAVSWVALLWVDLTSCFMWRLVMSTVFTRNETAYWFSWFFASTRR